MTGTEWLTWNILPAMGLTYGVVGAELLNLPRGIFLMAFPRIGRAFLGCVMCVGFWCAAAISAINETWGFYSLPVGRVVLTALALSGIFWQLTAIVAAIAARAGDGRKHGTQAKVDAARTATVTGGRIESEAAAGRDPGRP